MRWATTTADIDGADLVVLPGSKHVAADATWLREHRLDVRLRAHAAAGGRVLGLCGGAMLLGTEVRDSSGVEGATSGLGLLPLRTVMSLTKVTRRVTIEFPAMDGDWSALSGLRADGYEIRNGVVHGTDCAVAPLAWRSGSVLATTIHGLLEAPEIVHALCGVKVRDTLEDTFDLLADAVDEHLDVRLVRRMTTG
jgi:adenosylcobyric acid synthase